MAVDESPLFVSSFARGLQVLKAFGPGNPSMSLAETAEVVGMTRSAAQRFVFTLETLGYLRKEVRGRRYHLTVKTLELGMRYIQTSHLVERANPYLHELNRITGESCNLTEPDETDIVYVARFSAHEQISVHIPIGTRMPMYCSSGGRAYLSALPEGEAETLLRASHLVAHTEHTLTDVGKLLDIIGQARERGYAYAVEEYFIGDVAVAAPVVDASGYPLGAVNIAVPTSRGSPEIICKKLAPHAIAAARAISNTVRNIRMVNPGISDAHTK